jgi:hypothetical protein
MTTETQEIKTFKKPHLGLKKELVDPKLKVKTLSLKPVRSMKKSSSLKPNPLKLK